MARIELIDRIKEGLLFLDGAMGTQLFARGIEAGKCNDYLNVESSDIVSDVHSAYVNAGSDAVITNTFGANEYTLKRHGHATKVKDINLLAVQLARRAAGPDRYVLGDIGPCGDFLEPLGRVKPNKLEAAFVRQAKALIRGGVDGFIIETMTALNEMVVAIQAVKSVSDLPIFTSFAFDSAADGFRTMMGTKPEAIIEQLAELDIAAIGFNCGTLDMAEYADLTKVCADAIGDRPIALLAEPNAGKPELQGTRAVYSLSPEEFADAAEQIHAAGATIIGGCCGTGPKHIQAMVKRLTR